MFRHFALTGIILAAALGAWANPALAEDETQQLNQRITRLENQITQMQSQMMNGAPLAFRPAWANAYQDPFLQMENMQQQMDRVLNEASPQEGMNVYNLNVEKMGMEQKPEEYIITLDLPGMDKSRINVHLKQHDLIISGNKEQETQKTRPKARPGKRPIGISSTA